MEGTKVKRPRKDQLHYRIGGGYSLEEGADPRSWQPADWRSSEEVAQIIAKATGTDAMDVLNALKDAYVVGVERRLQEEEERKRVADEEAARREANAAELRARLVSLGLDDLFTVQPSSDGRGRKGDGLSIRFVARGTEVGDESQASHIVSRLEEWKGVNG